jgi:hypothetical protein
MLQEIRCLDKEMKVAVDNFDYPVVNAAIYILDSISKRRKADFIPLGISFLSLHLVAGSQTMLEKL